MPRFRSLANPVGVTYKLIRKLGVKVTESTVVAQLENHPDYPSLLAISDCLSEWDMPNQAYQISRQDYDPAEMEFPFIAHLRFGGGTYMLVHSINDGQVTFSDEKVNNGVIPEDRFLAQWSGVALTAQANQNSGEANYSSQRVVEVVNTLKVPAFLVLVFGALLSSLDFEALTFSYLALLSVKLVGVTMGVLLLLHSIDSNNPLVQNLCALGSKNNCNAILKSDAAKVFSWLSWSEVGFYYFCGSALSLLIVPGSLPLLAWLNVFALPYTVYSLTYQYRHKNWCLLCSIVQAVLVSEVVINFTANGSFDLQKLAIADWKSLLLLVISFSLPIIAWQLVRPILLKSALVAPLKSQLKKFKYNGDLFNQLLTNQPRYGVSEELMPIKLGNPAAPTIITMVSNPFCGPCAKAHQEIDEWLRHREDIQLKIIFTTADHDSDERTQISRHMNALSLLKDAVLVERALNDWYKLTEKKYETWAAKYPITFNGEMNKVTAKQKEWCDMAEIAYTPTILVNGYKLPEPYRLEDIKYLLS